MASLKEATAGDLASLQLRMRAFLDSVEWQTLKGFMERARERIFDRLKDAKLSGDQLKFTQGELAQANDDILLVERFLGAIDSELRRRERQEERQ